MLGADRLEYLPQCLGVGPDTLFRHSLRLREAALGADHPDTVTSRYGVAGGCWSTGRYTEAIECALKLARKRRAGGEFVVLERGFHGRTYGALSATTATPVDGYTASLTQVTKSATRIGRRICRRRRRS